MKKYSLLLLLAVLSLTSAAAAQEFPTEPSRVPPGQAGRREGRFDEALTRLDKVIAKNPATRCCSTSGP